MTVEPFTVAPLPETVEPESERTIVPPTSGFTEVVLEVLEEVAVDVSFEEVDSVDVVVLVVASVEVSLVVLVVAVELVPV